MDTKQNLSNGNNLATIHLIDNMKCDFETMRNQFYSKGIKISYTDDKIILSATRTGRYKYNNIYLSECNGLILERDTWKPLCIPPRSLRLNIDTNQANKYIYQGLYYIYHATDGTSFNMYYDKKISKWLISTTSGYDMGNVKWSEKTFEELISECLMEQYKISWEAFCDTLDTDYCYSWIFKHPDLHKFYSDETKYKIWFIQNVCLASDSEYYLCANEKSPNMISGQVKYTEPVGNLHDLYKLSCAALADYISDKKINYGYILRSVNYELTELHSDLFIESSLMKIIRKTWYENFLIDECNKFKLNKETVITLYNYLNADNFEDFQILFPQYQSKFDTYSSVIKSIISLMVEMFNKQENKNAEVDKKEKNILEITAEKILLLFEKYNYNIKKFTDEKKSKIFLEFILHTDMLRVLLPVM